MRCRIRASFIARLAGIAAVCLLIPACGSKISKENFEKVKTDMTEAEVVAIMGPPTQAVEAPAAGQGMIAKVLHWKLGNDVFMVTILNGKVQMKGSWGMDGDGFNMNVDKKNLKVK
jgi:hypothetical protein